MEKLNSDNLLKCIPRSWGDRRLFYVAWNGKEGPLIYMDKKDMLRNVENFPGAVYLPRAFTSLISAGAALEGNYKDYKGVIVIPEYIGKMKLSF
ncbi:MAG: hypothetical protein PHD97_00775 [Bacteroidales bacterium]|nr:hypothetical protein [Bacteroidales bacterium]